MFLQNCSRKVILLEENIPPAEIQAALPRGAFIDPLYIDFPRRRLTPVQHRHEDALYLHRAAVSEFASFGYTMENGAS